MSTENPQRWHGRLAQSVSEFIEQCLRSFQAFLSVEKMMPSFLIVAITFGFLSTVALLFFREVPTASEKIAYMMLGILASKFGDIVGWHFNSSSGSAKKTDLLSKSNGTETK